MTQNNFYKKLYKFILIFISIGLITAILFIFNKYVSSTLLSSRNILKKNQFNPILLFPLPWAFNSALWGDLTPACDFVAYINQTQEHPLPKDVKYTYHVNKMGFRGKEQIICDDTRKVLLLGDGHVFGVGVDNNKDIASWLNSIFKAHSPYSSIVVLNAGMPGYTITDELNYIREKGSMIRPNLVIVIVPEDDIWEIKRPTLIREEFKKISKDAGYFLIFYFKKRLKWRLFNFKEFYLSKTGFSEDRALNKLVPDYIKLAISLKDEVAKWRGRTLFILKDKILEPAMKNCELDYFRINEPPKRTRSSIYLPDGHWTADMCRFIADDIFEWIKKHDYLEL